MSKYLITKIRTDGGETKIEVMDEDSMFHFVNRNRQDGEEDNPWRFKVERIGDSVMNFNYR